VAWTQRDLLTRPSQPPPGAAIPTATVVVGEFERSLRAGGTISAQRFATIRAPRMEGGGRDAGRSSNSLTLTNLAEPGSMVQPGAVVASFEVQWLEDHLDDRRSVLTQARADVQKKRSEIMIALETEQQALRTAKAAWDKALLDLRTAEVRSDIEREILKLAAEEAEAAYQQLQKEVELQKISHEADLRSVEILVEKDRLHVERHENDLRRTNTTTPVGGLVVLESISRGQGQFDQVQTGDEVNPGTLFMRVVDLSKMIVSGSLNQVDSQLVKIGQRAQIRLDAYPDLVLDGRVVSIGALAASGSPGQGWNRPGRDDYVKRVSLEIAIQGEDPRVIPDLSASAEILIDEQSDRVLVPRSALRQKDGKLVVDVRSGGRFTEREVEIGATNPTHAVVLKGLEAGEEVALQRAPGA
jgi:multidrug resistance efflux pump